MNVRVPMRVLRSASFWYPELLCFRAPADPRGRVALTFDDGPHEECTPRLLDALAAAGARATFFVQGSNAARHAELVRRAAREGHQVAAHGLDHVSALQQRSADVLRNAERGYDTLVDILGEAVPRDFRPPYGDMTWGGLRALRGGGFRLAYWSYDSHDSFVSTGEEIVTRLREQSPGPGSVLLFHDDYRQTADALPAVIAALRSRNLSMATFEDLFARPAHGAG